MRMRESGVKKGRCAEFKAEVKVAFWSPDRRVSLRRAGRAELTHALDGGHGNYD